VIAKNPNLADGRDVLFPATFLKVITVKANLTGEIEMYPLVCQPTIFLFKCLDMLFVITIHHKQKSVVMGQCL
jgi:hypothetical protein